MIAARPVAPRPYRPEPPTPGAAILRTLIRLAVIVVLALAIHQATGWLTERISNMPFSLQSPTRIALLAALLIAYAALLAMPFVPGIEIGLTVLMVYGAQAAIFVYLATCLGLLFAYAIGRYFPLASLMALFRDLHMRRVCALMTRLEPLDGAQRLALIRDHLPRRVAAPLLRWRYLAVALLLNIPGNAVIGGGGGIMLIAGLSRLFAARMVALVVLLAVAPVPAMVLIFGPAIIE